MDSGSDSNCAMVVVMVEVVVKTLKFQLWLPVWVQLWSNVCGFLYHCSSDSHLALFVVACIIRVVVKSWVSAVLP